MRVRMGSLIRRVRTFFDRTKLDERLRDEWQLHADLMADDHVRQGLSPDEARRQTRLAIGGLDQVREASRDALGFRFLDDLVQDIRFALRQLRRTPAFTAVAVLTLALGIGANTAVFSVVKSVLLGGLPYGQPDQLVRVWVTNPRQGFDRDITSYPRFEDWRVRSRRFQDFAGFTGARLILTGVEEPVQLRGAAVTANFLRVLGVHPVLGRDFEEGDDLQGRPRKVLLSHGFWLREFGGDAAIIGRTLTLSGQSFSVAGVLPATFQFPERALDFWTPMALDERSRQARGDFWMNVVGRLREGVNLRQAQAEMNSIAQALQSEFPAFDQDLGVALVGLKEDLTGPIRLPLRALTGAAIFILLICCSNIAGMLSARAAAREHELAIRAALGAGKGRVAKQLVTEALLLFFCGGVLGIAVAYAVLGLLLRLAPAELSQMRDTRLDLTVIGFTLAVSALCGLIFGLRPAVEASRLDLTGSLKQRARGVAGRTGSRRFRAVLTIGEMAMAMVLLTGAWLLIRSFQQVQGVQLGFDVQRVSIAQIQLPRTKYPDGTQSSGFYDRLLLRLRNTPGIESAAAISELFLGRLPSSAGFTIEGRPDPIPTPLTMDSVTPDFFSMMKIPLLKGRSFTTFDHANALPVAIINETTARRYWPSSDPLGRRFTFGNPGPGSRWYTIVGIAADTRRAGVDQPAFTESYFPLAQQPSLRMQILIRTAPGLAAAKSALQAAVRESDRDQPISRFESLGNALGDRVASRRFITLLLSLFAATAVAIAGVGLYGLISYLVTQRCQEFGIRVALGAKAGDVVRIVVGWVMAMSGLGVALGFAGALILSRGLERLLFGVTRFDAVSYIVAAAGLLLVCLAAAVPPGIRAIRVDPLTALRAE